MFTISTSATRRRALSVVAGGATLASGLWPGRPRAAPRLDLSDPAQRLRAYMLMRGALDERLVLSCISCRYFGVVDAKTIPFFDLVAASFARFRPARGGYEGVSFELEYFIDRETGDVLDQWRNPLTGETVTARHVDSPGLKLFIGPDARLVLPQAFLASGATYEQPPMQIIGDNLWITERTTFAYPATEGSKPVSFDETSTYHTRLSDLAKHDRRQARSDSQYLGISSFRPWQNMGDHPGHMVGVGVGAVGLTMADLPQTWIRATRKRHPEAFSNPGGYLEPLWKSP